VYFFTIRQIWDFLNVVVEKPPHGALEESLELLDKHQPLKDGNSEGLLKSHSQLRAVCEGAQLSGTLSTLYLLELLEITDSIIKNMSAKEQAVFRQSWQPCHQASPRAIPMAVGVHHAIAAGTAEEPRANP
jgi:hypothetical protein